MNRVVLKCLAGFRRIHVHCCRSALKETEKRANGKDKVKQDYLTYFEPSQSLRGGRKRESPRGVICESYRYGRVAEFYCDCLLEILFYYY